MQIPPAMLARGSAPKLKRLGGEIPVFHDIAFALALFNGFRRFWWWHDDIATRRPGLRRGDLMGIAGLHGLQQTWEKRRHGRSILGRALARSFELQVPFGVVLRVRTRDALYFLDLPAGMTSAMRHGPQNDSTPFKSVKISNNKAPPGVRSG